MIRILVADDHQVVRAGIIAFLNLETDFRVVAEAGTGEEALRLYRELRPDVVTMDLRMPGIGGQSTISAICTAFPDAKVLVLTSLIGDEQIHRALESGAIGYLLKDTESGDLTSAIRAAHLGASTVPKDVAKILVRRDGLETLSAREIEVLQGVAKGRGNKEIGDDLGISDNTVKGYLKAIAFKLDAPDRTAAVVIAMKRGLLHLDDLS